MSQQIADLVINLSADSTSFTEQVGRVERQLQQAAQNTSVTAKHGVLWFRVCQTITVLLW